MKVPYEWLGEWVKVPWAAAELGSRLTLAGFELEGIGSAAPAFSDVVVAEIVSAERHPQADKLQVCRVATGTGAPLQIVCGAANARKGLKTALARIGAVLPGGLTISAARLRGVESQGMLASAKELGLAETSSGILELPDDAPLGQPLREYLHLDEAILELAITPNRGDAMSVLGVAREVAALTGAKLKGADRSAVAPGHPERFAVRLKEPAACPRFAGCIVRGVDNSGQSPLWLRERLRRAGLRAISPVVDVTNYVMLELGNPMHAYDLGKLQGSITVRRARQGEPLALLDGRTVSADADMLLIADEAGGIGLGGIMGGARTAVSTATTDVFFECAWFAPEALLGRSRRLGIVTDAGQRFERGVDPTGQEGAIARALAILLPIAGGKAGPIVVEESPQHLPRRPKVALRSRQLGRLLGTDVPPERVKSALEGLGMTVEVTTEGWAVTPPAHRFDIAIEADLIEEVARLIGLDSIAEAPAQVSQAFRRLPAERPAEVAMLNALAARGYHEVITYAFVDPALQGELFPGTEALALANPIASDLAVMRVSLWPGLIKAALENQHRQQERIRLFERGTRFVVAGGQTREIDTLAALALGGRLPEQWGVPKESRGAADFYDIKGDLEALLGATGDSREFVFEAAVHPVLHPGRTARVLRRGQLVGWVGELHPGHARRLDFTYPPVLFEIDVDAALGVRRPAYAEISRFPAMRRDLAIVVGEDVALSRVAERVTLAATSLLRDLRVFDVYRGPGLEQGRKSIALGLIFQDISRTLTDEDVDRLMAAVVADLRENLDARVRE